MQSARAKPILLVLFLAIMVPDFAAADLRVRPAEWAQPVIGFDLGNFYQVSAEVYRSQQPTHGVSSAASPVPISGKENVRSMKWVKACMITWA